MAETAEFAQLYAPITSVDLGLLQCSKPLWATMLKDQKCVSPCEDRVAAVTVRL